MSSETIVTGLFLISAVVAAGILINAIFPAIYQTADTFGSISSQAETKIRTDFRIANAFATDNSVKVWLKNVGSARLHIKEINNGDLYAGKIGDFGWWPLERCSIDGEGALDNYYWDPGETIEITKEGIDLTNTDEVYIAIVLPNGVRREMIFSKS
jgi:flagellar protein FlaG